MLTDRFATTLTTDWHSCYQKFGSFATSVDLLPGLAILLTGLADLLSKYCNIERLLLPATASDIRYMVI